MISQRLTAIDLRVRSQERTRGRPVHIWLITQLIETSSTARRCRVPNRVIRRLRPRGSPGHSRQTTQLLGRSSTTRRNGTPVVDVGCIGYTPPVLNCKVKICIEGDAGPVGRIKKK